MLDYTQLVRVIGITPQTVRTHTHTHTPNQVTDKSGSTVHTSLHIQYRRVYIYTSTIYVYMNTMCIVRVVCHRELYHQMGEQDNVLYSYSVWVGHLVTQSQHVTVYMTVCICMYSIHFYPHMNIKQQ